MNSSERFLSAELDRRGDSFRVALSVRSAPASGAGRDGAARSSLLDTAEHEARHVVAAKACGLSIAHATIDRKVAPVGAAGCVSLVRDDYSCKPLWAFSDRTLQELIGAPPIIDGHVLSRETCTFVFARTIMALAPDRCSDKDLMQATALARVVASDSAAFLDFARADAARILAARQHQVAAIADALLIEWTLPGAAIDEILAGMSPAQRAERLRKKQWHDVAAGAALFTAAHGDLMRLNL